ncbi:LysR family transcriptional regulator [Bordetella petrii]|uniref:LysR family transcriptional regulator n=1 Tax=Bordetella petrii TaxID=94624 RepID=UPI001E54FB4D|nr:LysR family transcriptional regulator [Bordetella petrii]MCD0501949.1 LysR family transcriptional regulator [Bordetella petrii]
MKPQPIDATASTPGDDARIAPPLSLRQIEVFRAIMVAGSISGAGRMLHVSQPAVSRVLALTETRLGYPLFERSKSRLLPTPEALRLYGEVEQVYGGIQRVNDLAASLGRRGSGVLRVVASASFGQGLIPRAMERFLARNRSARVDFRSVTFDEMVGYFLSGRADVGISMSSPDHPNLSSTRVGEDAIVCVMPPDHPLVGREVVHAADFSSASWIGYPEGTPLGRALETFFGAGPVCPPAIEVHSPVTAHAFVQQGLGPALVDGWCIPPESTVVQRPIEPPAQVEIWATHSNLAPLPLLGRRFLSALGSVLADTSNFVRQA